MEIRTTSLRARPEFEPECDALSRACWPPFLLHDEVRGWRSLFDRFPEFQILLLDPADRVVAVGHTVPLIWSGTAEDLPATISEILARAGSARESGSAPTALAAVAAMVRPEARGQGLSVDLVRAMTALAAEHHLGSLIAPVRPTQKSLHPEMTLDAYSKLTRANGSPVDPWIRVHWRLGAEQIAIAPCTLTVEGTVAEWERWTGMSFPRSGRYEVPGALQRVVIDCERDRGLYEDPNVWMRHAVKSAAGHGAPTMP